MARTPKRHVLDNGEVRWRVRYRDTDDIERSETFRALDHAETFARIIGNGKRDNVAEALTWLASKRDETVTATFGQFFETWAGQVTGVTKRTKADYDALHRRYLTSLDPHPLPLITKAHVAELVNDMERTYSPKTIKHAINLLSTVLADAQEEGLIARNPVKRVRLPEVVTSDGDYLFLTHQEAGELIAAMPDFYRPFVIFLFGTGLRWSEATALQVKHVDLENGTVRVDRAWKRVPGVGFEIGPPKSKKSRRTVNAAVPALIAAHHLIQGRRPNDILFETVTGKVIRHANFYNRIWVPACIKAGMTDPRPTPHDCRSTFGSWLLSEPGIDLVAVQDQLGHESYETTRKIYAHLLPAVGVAAGRAASAAMTRALAGVEGMDLGVRAIEAGTDADQPAQA